MSLFRPLIPIQSTIGQNVLSMWNTHADMVAGVVSPVNDGLYGVRTSTGVWPLNKKRGLWRYTGSAFEWFSDFDTEFTDAQFKIHGGTSGVIQFMATLLTGLRQFIWPDDSGTVALSTGVTGGQKITGGLLVDEDYISKANPIDSLQTLLDSSGNIIESSSSKAAVLEYIINQLATGEDTKLSLKNLDAGTFSILFSDSGRVTFVNDGSDIFRISGGASTELFNLTTGGVEYNRTGQDFDFKWKKLSSGHWMDYNSGNDTLEFNTAIQAKQGVIYNVANDLPYVAGQVSFDSTELTHLMDTAIAGVRYNAGQELWIPFYNDTGVPIDDGKAINASGVDATNNVLKGIYFDNTDPQKSASFIGLATHLVPPETVGLATYTGKVRGVDTFGLAITGPTYAGINGNLTTTKPLYPDVIMIIGATVKAHLTDGIVQVVPARFTRISASASEPFTSQGVGSGVYYLGGFYEWNATSIILSQGNLTQAFGTSGKSTAAHPGVVAEAVGIVDTGQVGLRVTGTLDSETGPQTAAQTQVITDDITSLNANELYETLGKFSGIVIFELYVVSGAPTAYSININYGTSAYADFQNKDVTLTGFTIKWLGGFNDSNANIEVMHHKPIGWAFATTGFVPGNGNIAARLDDQAIAPNVVNGQYGKWKKVDVDQFIDGNGSEGIILRVTTTQNNTYQQLNANIQAVSEELTD